MDWSKYKGDFLKNEDVEVFLSKYNKKTKRLCLCTKYNSESHYFESKGSFNRICPECKAKQDYESTYTKDINNSFPRIAHKVRLQENI